ncbi:hypothetical protein BSKO_01914 [Bryopsis sp. KO-2023]|nr:hypothetical protein BSKO_01914 [Bryopsis sp. KO-2023]
MQTTCFARGRAGISLRLGFNCTRIGRPYRARSSPTPCSCSSSPVSDPLSDLNSALKTPTDDSSVAPSVNNMASASEVGTSGQAGQGDGQGDQKPVDVEGEVAEIVAEGITSRSTEEMQTQTADDNVISVGVGENAILLDKSKVMGLAKNTLLVFLGVTFSIAVFSTVKKFLTPQAQRTRTVNKNRELVEELMKYLPGNREGLTAKVVWVLRVKTGFTTTEIFRKYLWFLLRERSFDQEAVDDLVHLKNAMDMGDEEVSAALNERAQRIYDKYGTLMLNTQGLTGSGIERKATCKALFSKLLYLINYEPLLNPESEGYNSADLRKIFGATESDVEKLRIVSLQEVDMDALDKLATAQEPNVAESAKEE